RLSRGRQDRRDRAQGVAARGDGLQHQALGTKEQRFESLENACARRSANRTVQGAVKLSWRVRTAPRSITTVSIRFIMTIGLLKSDRARSLREPGTQQEISIASVDEARTHLVERRDRELGRRTRGG